MHRRVLRARAQLAALAAVLFVAGVVLAPASGDTSGTVVSVSQTAGLTSGQTVSVSGTGFHANATVDVYQCHAIDAPPAAASPTENCTVNPLAADVAIGGDGVLPARSVVVTSTFTTAGGGIEDCATLFGCRIFVLETVGTPSRNAHRAISFGAPATGGLYTPLTPARILDTRNGTGSPAAPVGSGATRTLQVTGAGGVPASGVVAVAMNVTVTQPSATGFLTLFPTGTTRPLAANLNFTPGKTVANLVVVKLGTGGKVDVFNSAGSTHVVADVAGWFSTSPTGNPGRLRPLTPARIHDTRAGAGARVAAGASLEVQVAGVGGVPATGALAVVLDVAVTATTATSFLTVHPSGVARPLAANLNWVTGDTVGNRVFAKLGANGKVTIYNHAGLAHVIVDVNGWFTDASVASTGTGAFVALNPARILDSRDGTGGVSGVRAAGSTVDVQVNGQGGAPPSGVSAAVLNATAVGPAAAGFLTIFPAGTARPGVSDLNYAAGEVRPNLVVVAPGTGGKVSLYTSAATHAVFDVAGYFT